MKRKIRAGSHERGQSYGGKEKPVVVGELDGMPSKSNPDWQWVIV
jgi:hypothetical protein